MLRRGIAVDKGQVAGDAALIIEDNNAAAAGHFQNIAVEIEGDLAEDGQGAADVDILRQPDDIRRTVRQSGDQLLFRFDFPVCLTRGKRRSRRKAEQHTNCEQDTKYSFFHFSPPPLYKFNQEQLL